MSKYKPVMVGAALLATTVKLLGLLAEPPGAVTATVPDVALAGTVTLRRVREAAVTEAITPLKVTVLAAGVLLKPDPSIETVAPGAARPGDSSTTQVEARLACFHERHHVSYARLVEVCRDLFGRAIHLHGIRDTLTPDSFTRRRRRIENAVDRSVFRTFLLVLRRAGRDG